MTLRAVAILLAAALSLAIWRSGTQLARDQLTGMLSRLGAERVLDREIARGRRPAVWVCDLDNFSAVNRQLGARTGDAVLLRHVAKQPAARRRLATGRIADCTAGWRHLPDRQRDAATPMPSRSSRTGSKRRSGRRRRAWRAGGPVRLSVGAAIAAPGETAAHLVPAAERNMRAAKGWGPSASWSTAAASGSSRTATSLLSSELYGACERGELELHIQPIVALADGTPVGGETLARWNHPQRGLVYPLEFLPEAEQDSALMAVISNALGDVFHELVTGSHNAMATSGCHTGSATTWRRSGCATRPSPRPCARISSAPGCGARRPHQRRGDRGRADGHRRRRPGGARRLQGAGYCLALDDFGTGHSSLAHLRDFPLDTVKLDMSFVQSMGRSPIDRAIVEAVADIASVSGLKVIAEGVETPSSATCCSRSSRTCSRRAGSTPGRCRPSEFEAWVLDRKRATVA